MVLLSRPENFRLNPRSPLFKGLVFAGLGGGLIKNTIGSTIYQDSSVYQKHGVLVGYNGVGNTPADRWQWDSTLNRFILGFNGSNDYVVSSAAAITTFPFTLAAWLKVETADTYEYTGVCLDKTWNAFYGVGLYKFYGSSHQARVHTRFYGGGNRSEYGGTYVSDVAWHHCAVVFAAATERRLYIDGKLDGAGTTSYAFTAVPVYTLVGRSTLGGTAFLLKGQVADTLVYNRALDGDAIATLANPYNVDLHIGSVPLIFPVWKRKYFSTTKLSNVFKPWYKPRNYLYY